ncbi:MAG: ectoine hydroxylase [Spirochaetales bacterium]|nr:ectoine hydroxylase [Leptospiraceae bacterium]MCP5482683.1 ectoine hydroxylase [Spirochaetales bacterium]MCP5485065.1 ectoine hydroxylase [Spirochaetales bacterium]
MSAAIRKDLYVSRLSTAGSSIRREEPVVYASTPPPAELPAEALEQYARDGFLVVPELLDAVQIEQLNRHIDELLAGVEPDQERAIREPGSLLVRSLFQVHKTSAPLRALSRNPRLLGIVRYLLGDDVYMHQSRVNLKPAFHGREFFWHSDFETWHSEDGMPAMRALSVSIALTDNSNQNGALMVMPGSHLDFYPCAGQTPPNHYRDSLRSQNYGVPDEETLRKIADRCGIMTPEVPVGSALVFDCNLMHGSNSNITPYARRNVFLVYNSISNVPGEPYAAAQKRPDFVASREDLEIL